MLKKFGNVLVSAQNFILKFLVPDAVQGARKYTAFVYATLVFQALAAYLLWTTKIDAETWVKAVVPIQIALASGFFAGNAIAHFSGSEDSSDEEEEHKAACEKCGQKLPEAEV